MKTRATVRFPLPPRRWKFARAALLAAVAPAGGSSLHAETRPDAPAEFVVTTEVVAKNPERFGANLPQPELNQFVPDPSMEGQIVRLTGKATGGGADFLVNDHGETTDFYDCLKDGFFDGATIRVYRVGEGAEPFRLVRRDRVKHYGASAAGGHRIALEHNDPAAAVQAGDLYFLDLRVDELDRSKVADRLSHLPPHASYKIGGTQWDQKAEGLATLSRDSSTHAPENGGRSSLKVEGLRAEGVRVSSEGAYSDPDNGWYPTLTPGVKYRWEAWMKQTGLPTGEVTLALSADYGAVKGTFTVTGEWKKYAFDFTGPDYPKKGSPVITHGIEFTGPGTLWVDNLSLYEAALPPYAMRPAAARAFKDFHPGSMRVWSGHTNMNGGTTMENFTDPEEVNALSYDFNNGGEPAPKFHLPTALRFAEETGATPWLIISQMMDEDEWRFLADYLAGPAGTPGADKRIAQGRRAPWTDSFDKIRIEYGNESWNTVFINFLNPTYGKMAEYYFDIFKGQPAVARVGGKFDFCLNGFVLQPSGDGYGATAHQAAPAGNVVDVTTYIGGWEVGKKNGGGGLNDQGFQNLLLYAPWFYVPLGAGHAATRDANNRAPGSHPYGLAVYEGGPGYDLPAPGKSADPADEVYGKSLAAGVATLDAFLYNSQHGFGAQNYFSFQTGTYWTSHTTPAHGYRPHPAWLALQMRNAHARGDMVNVETRSVPTRDVLAVSEYYPQRSDLPLTASYAFRDGDRWSVFVLSRKLNGDTPVTLHLPFTGAGAATLYRLAGNPRETNLDDMEVAIRENPMDVAKINPADYRFAMPAGSIYLFVFEGVKGAAKP